MTALNTTTQTVSGTDLFRRGSLLALAGAMWAAVAGTSQARAGKRSKKADKRDKKRAAKLCRQQVEGCRAAYIDMCGEITRPFCVELRDAILECCDHLADCQAGETLACIAEQETRIDERR